MVCQKHAHQNSSRWELDCERRAKNEAELRQAINILSGVDVNFIELFCLRHQVKTASPIW